MKKLHLSEVTKLFLLAAIGLVIFYTIYFFPIGIFPNVPVSAFASLFAAVMVMMVLIVVDVVFDELLLLQVLIVTMALVGAVVFAIIPLIAMIIMECLILVIIVGLIFELLSQENYSKIKKILTAICFLVFFWGGMAVRVFLI